MWHPRVNTGAVVLGLIVLSLAAAAWAEFDSRGWRYVRQISIPGDLPDGPVVVPLMSHIIEKCRPDLGDLRVVSTEGIAVSAAVGGTDPPRKNNLLPAKIYRIAKRPGAWTDIWIDKGTKTLGSGVLIGTGSRDFVRKVEVRGSDNGKDLYVIRMDGLIIDRKEPIPLRSLDIEHPLNNFQYVVLRIHDDGEPPLKIESVSCYPPMPEHGLSHPLSVRMIENRVDAHRSATVIVAELRNNDHPLSDVAINTRTKDFVKNVVVHCSSSASGPWNRVFEGAFFRATSGDVGKENLKVAFKPQACRFLMLELAGPSGPPVQVDGIEATSTIPFIAFDHSRGRSYRLYYGNESAALLLSPPLLPSSIQAIASASSGIRLGQEEENVPAPREESRTAMSETKSVGLGWWATGPALLLLALVIIVGIMVRSRRMRRNRRRGGRRLLDMS